MRADNDKYAGHETAAGGVILPFPALFSQNGRPCTENGTYILGFHVCLKSMQKRFLYIFRPLWNVFFPPVLPSVLLRCPFLS